MTERRRTVTISTDTARAWWQLPDGLWRKVGLLQRLRLRRTIEGHVLPVLQELEGLYLRDRLGATPRLVGKSFAEIEKDDVAIEAALFLFNLALSEELLAFAGDKGRPVSSETAAVGSCGMSMRAARRLYLGRACRIILEKAGHAATGKDDAFARIDFEDVRELQKLRNFVRFDPLSVRELKKGLKGRMGELLQRDEAYLEVLHKCRPIQFMRALRYALAEGFSQIAKWEPEFLAAVAEGLDHSAKIMALGTTLLSIEDPEVVRALGTWPMKEVPAKGGGKGGKKRKKFVTRIGQVKELMGGDFQKLLACSPEVIKDAASWKNEDLTQFRNYLEILTPGLMDALAPLPVKQKVALLDGLWTKLGRDFMEHDIKQPGGISVIENILGEYQEMTKRGSAPKDIKGAIEGSDIFDKHMARFLRKR